MDGELKSWRFWTDSCTVNDIIETEIKYFIGADNSIRSDIIRTKEIRDYYMQNKGNLLKKILSLVLYICSDEPEIEDVKIPGIYPKYPERIKTKKGFRLFPAKGPRYWQVGESTGNALSQTTNAHEQEKLSTNRRVRAHLRRGHWHGFWSGKLDAPELRKFSYRWLPPQLVGGTR